MLAVALAVFVGTCSRSPGGGEARAGAEDASTSGDAKSGSIRVARATLDRLMIVGRTIVAIRDDELALSPI